MKIDRAETLRYLGFRGQELSEADERNLARAEEICLSAISPKSVVKKYGFDCKTMSVEGTNVVSEAMPSGGILSDATPFISLRRRWG